MKKLTTLVALILCVTVGGVYAAWSYTGNTLTAVDRTLSHGMATATTTGDVGILEIIYNDVDIKIDQTAPGDYKANLVVTGSVRVKFTPNDGAPDDVVNKAIGAQAYVYTQNADAYRYEDTEIYVPTDARQDLNWVGQDDGTFLATITADEIKALFRLGKAFELPTYAAYEAFHDLEEHVTLTLYIAKK